MMCDHSNLWLIDRRLPYDCRVLISDFLPRIVLERCHICGLPVVMGDRRGRMHVLSHIACTESIILCCECFELLHE